MPELAPSREKELMDQVASLKSSVEKLSRGEYTHKEILFNNPRDYGKRGLGSFPEPNQGTTPSPEIKTRDFFTDCSVRTAGARFRLTGPV